SHGGLVFYSGFDNFAFHRLRAVHFGTGGGGLCGDGGVLVGGRRGVFVVAAAGFEGGVDVGQRGELGCEFACAGTGRGDGVEPGLGGLGQVIEFTGGQSLLDRRDAFFFRLLGVVFGDP